MFIGPGLYPLVKRWEWTYAKEMFSNNNLYIFQHGVPISCKARQVTTSDFTRFTHILAADENNLRDLLRKKPSNATADIRLWGSYLDNKPIADPYYDSIVRCFYLCLT